MKYVAIDKRSKKEQKKFYSSQRRDWGNLDPITKVIPNKKGYSRARVSRELRGMM